MCGQSWASLALLLVRQKRPSWEKFLSPPSSWKSIGLSPCLENRTYFFPSSSLTALELIHQHRELHSLSNSDDIRTIIWHTLSYLPCLKLSCCLSCAKNNEKMTMPVRENFSHTLLLGLLPLVRECAWICPLSPLPNPCYSIPVAVSVTLRLDEITPREVHLSITQPDEAPWAAYILEIADRVGPEILEPVKERNVTKVRIDDLEPGTPYRVRVRPVKDKEPPVWIGEVTFNTPGETRTGSKHSLGMRIWLY